MDPLVLDAFGGADLLEGRLRKVRRLPFIISCRNLTQNPSGRQLAQLDRHEYLFVVILVRGFLMYAAESILFNTASSRKLTAILTDRVLLNPTKCMGPV